MIARIATIAVVSISPAIAWAMGADHGTEPVGNSGWPKGLAEIVNTDRRVHGYFVNWQDVFFFHGNTQALNAFLVKFATLQGTQRKVVVHPGRLDVKSPWDKQARKIAAEWQLYTSPHVGFPKPSSERREPFVAQVDVYLGGDVRLSELQVPADVRIESSGEIEDFVRRHRTQRD